MALYTFLAILVIISGTISALLPEELEGALRGLEDAALAARKTLQVSCESQAIYGLLYGSL